MHAISSTRLFAATRSSLLFNFFLFINQLQNKWIFNREKSSVKNHVFGIRRWKSFEIYQTICWWSFLLIWFNCIIWCSYFISLKSYLSQIIKDIPIYATFFPVFSFMRKGSIVKEELISKVAQKGPEATDLFTSAKSPAFRFENTKSNLFTLTWVEPELRSLEPIFLYSTWVHQFVVSLVQRNNEILINKHLMLY